MQATDRALGRVYMCHWYMSHLVATKHSCLIITCMGTQLHFKFQHLWSVLNFVYIHKFIIIWNWWCMLQLRWDWNNTMEYSDKNDDLCRSTRSYNIYNYIPETHLEWLIGHCDKRWQNNALFTSRSILPNEVISSLCEIRRKGNNNRKKQGTRKTQLTTEMATATETHLIGDQCVLIFRFRMSKIHQEMQVGSQVRNTDVSEMGVLKEKVKVVKMCIRWAW